MRKFLIYLMAVCCFIPILISNTACGEALFDGASAILEQWGAKDGQELYTRILDHWNRNIDGTRISWPAKIRLGGTTGDLISEPGSWDLAIVSSKDVDLQKLADEGVVRPSEKAMN